MILYLKPPTEKALLRGIEEGVNTRLNFLLSVYERKPIETLEINIEHLCETSELDTASHYMLRFCCLFSEEFKKFFIETETKFFERRFKNLDMPSVRTLIDFLKKHLIDSMPDTRAKDRLDLFLTILNTCTEFLKRMLFKHAFNKQHSGSCRKFVIKVPFMHCYALLKRREVELCGGTCHVHCGVWGKLLSCFFRSLLLCGIENLRFFTIAKDIHHDVRIRSVVVKTLNTFNNRSNYYSEHYLVNSSVKAVEVDGESDFFPPCALNSLRSLRSKHRVGHHSRIQLTLFLKDIGMGVDEAIKFWREEYSKAPGRSKEEKVADMINSSCQREEKSTCSHMWNNSSSRYIYNIQHLYGLKGSCRTYQSRSCSSLQSTAMMGEGCPFEKMNSRELVKVLPPAVLKHTASHEAEYGISLKKILDLASQGKPKEACDTCFAAHSKAIFDQKLVTSIRANANCTPKLSSHLVESGALQEVKTSKLKPNCCPKESEVRCGNECMCVRNQVGLQSNLSSEVTERLNILKNKSRGEAVKSKGELSKINTADTSSAKESDFVNFKHDILFHSPSQYYLALRK